MKKQAAVVVITFLWLFLGGTSWLPTMPRAYAQGPKYNPEGKWLVPDPRDGKPWMIVEVKKMNGELQATLLSYPPGSRFASMKKCELCPKGDKRKNAPMIGIVIVEKLVPLGNRFVNGEYLDLENGRVYNCNVSIPKNDELWVEVGYGRMYKKQFWKRLK
jgi:hypothetical protein